MLDVVSRMRMKAVRELLTSGGYILDDVHHEHGLDRHGTADMALSVYQNSSEDW